MIIFVENFTAIEYILNNGRAKFMLHSREIIKMIKKDGWFFIGAEGDHYHFRHPAKPGKVTVPHLTKDLSIDLIKSIERQSGLKLKK